MANKKKTVTKMKEMIKSVLPGAKKSTRAKSRSKSLVGKSLASTLRGATARKKVGARKSNAASFRGRKSASQGAQARRAA